MSDEVLDAVTRARAAGAAARDPVGFAVIEAMARRAMGREGEVRAWLLRRVQERLTRLPLAGDAEPHASGLESDPPLAALTELVRTLGPVSAPAARSGPAVQGAMPPLRAVVDFKDTWSRLRAEQRLRQAMAQVPAKAGPLNSSSLVNRMLQTMHRISPEYLEAFMAHADTLMLLEQASGGALQRTPHRRA